MSQTDTLQQLIANAKKARDTRREIHQRHLVEMEDAMQVEDQVVDELRQYLKKMGVEYGGLTFNLTPERADKD